MLRGYAGLPPVGCQCLLAACRRKDQRRGDRQASYRPKRVEDTKVADITTCGLGTRGAPSTLNSLDAYILMPLGAAKALAVGSNAR